MCGFKTNMEICSLSSQTFTGYKSTFSKKLEKALVNPRTTSQRASKLLNDFAEMYEKKVCLNRKIGSGFYGTVYKIDDCYVLKRGNEHLEPEFGGIEVIRKRKFAHLKHYFGEAIAKIFNNNGEDMAIIKNVYSKGTSFPAGVPDDFAKTHTKDECFKYYADVYLPKFSSLPQRSFDGIAKDFAQLNKMCTKRKSYFFDFLNPNNFVLCGKTIRILDEINEYEKPTRNCVTDMLDVLLNRVDLDNDAIYDEKLVSMRKNLAKKIILAGARHNVPMCYQNTDLVSWQKTFNDILGMKDLNVNEMIFDIDNLVKLYDKPKVRVEAVNQYLEEIVGL